MSRRLPEPPRRADPDAIYSMYAPALWSAFAGDLELPELRLSILWHVGNGKTWCTHVDGSSLTATPDDCDTALIEFVSDRASWRIGIFDVWPRFVRFLQPHLAVIRRRLPAALAKFPPQPRIDGLAALPGTLDVEYIDDAGDMARFALRIAGGHGARGSLRLTDNDLWTLLRSRGKPSQLLRSRATLSGDVGWIVRLVRLFEGSGTEQ